MVQRNIKPMITKKKINIPLYFGDLNIVQGDDADIEEFSRRVIGFDMHGFDAYYTTLQTKSGYTHYYLVFRQDPTPKIIAHECAHLVAGVFVDHMIKADFDNDEPFCYLLGWVVEQCHKHLKVEEK